jgi:hypothetical protein
MPKPRPRKDLQPSLPPYVEAWFGARGWRAHPYQRAMAAAFRAGRVHAPDCAHWRSFSRFPGVQVSLSGSWLSREAKLPDAKTLWGLILQRGADKPHVLSARLRTLSILETPMSDKIEKEKPEIPASELRTKFRDKRFRPQASAKYLGLPGSGKTPSGHRFVCPKEGCGYKWSRQFVGDPVPPCPKHHVSLVRS